MAADYKLTANLIEYTPDNMVVRTWELKGCWVSGISESEFNSESNDKRLITANITYDKSWLKWQASDTSGLYTPIPTDYNV